MLRVGLAANGPSENGTISSSGVKGRPCVRKGKGCDTACKDSMTLNFIALSHIAEVPQNELAITAAGHQELNFV